MAVVQLNWNPVITCNHPFKHIHVTYIWNDEQQIDDISASRLCYHVQHYCGGLVRTIIFTTSLFTYLLIPSLCALKALIESIQSEVHDTEYTE